METNGNNTNDKEVIRDLNDLASLFVRSLKDLSKNGESLTLETLSENLATCTELKNLLDLASKRSETLAQPILEEEIERMRSQLHDIEDERKKAVSQLFKAENELDREHDFNKRLILALLRLSRAEENQHCHKALDEYKTLIVEHAPLENREKALAKIKNAIMKVDVGDRLFIGKQKKHTGLGELLRPGRQNPFKQLKKASIKALDELRIHLDKDSTNEIESLKDRIDETDDFEYLLSLRKPVLDVIATFVEKSEKEKEEVISFLRTIGDRLAALEKSIAASSESSQSNIKKDMTFNDDLQSEILDMSDTVRESDRIKEMKSYVLSHLDNVGSALTTKREEYVIRIEDTGKDHDKLREHFKQVITSLKDRNRILLEQSSRDPLTGIYNRRVFNEHLVSEFERFKRYKAPFSIIFFDIDHFKNVNDTYGHDAGDRALKGIAKSTSGILRKVDVFARFGGEEFVIILYETELTHAMTVARKLRKLIAETRFEYKDSVVPITISIGVTEARETDTDADDIVKRADKLLYYAKQRGRNRVISDVDVDDITPIS